MTTPRTRKANAPAMDNAPEPQDHKAPRREAEGAETVSLEFKGATYDIPADQEDWPLRAVQAFSKGMAIDGVEHLLGPRQWALFMKGNPTKRNFDEFSEQIAEEYGFGTAGN